MPLPAPLVAALRARFGSRFLDAPEDLLTYECDGHTLAREIPGAVALPESTEEVQAIVRLCGEFGVPFLARGAGTGLSGGAVARDGAVVLSTARMHRILSIDYEDRVARVQPGLVNLHLSLETSSRGYFYAPDPSSQGACTIGGNVAENSGGPHTLKYGVTSNHVLALTLVRPDGTLLRTGSAIGDAPGYDLTGLVVGSEGMLGVVTEVEVRLLPKPEAVRTFLAVYDSVDRATGTVSAIIASGIVPAALELVDAIGIQAVERHLKAGFPLDAAAVLLIELEGPAADLREESTAVLSICRAQGCRTVDEAADEATRQRFWKGRKQALGALGKLARGYYTLDGVVPPSRVPEALREIAAVASRFDLRIANVCHAGDGNMHPLILFDPASPEEVDRVHRAGAAILEACIRLGGALSGEHGIGLEKQELMPLLFSAADLDEMRKVRRAFDPDERCNPRKVFPTGAGCGELRGARAERIGGWL